jgi:hypothetical protein
MDTLDPAAAKDFRSHIERIAGESFVQKMSKAESMKSDIAFEAEAFFGTDQTKFDNHKKELLANFEEDLVGQELIQAMKKLREAEREGNNEVVAEMAKKCQVLSMRKSDILKNKK